MPTVKHRNKTSTMLLVEMQLGQPLQRLLMDWDAAGLRPDGIARYLGTQGINVTGMTIRNWIRELGGRRRLWFPSTFGEGE